MNIHSDLLHEELNDDGGHFAGVSEMGWVPQPSLNIKSKLQYDPALFSVCSVFSHFTLFLCPSQESAPLMLVVGTSHNNQDRQTDWQLDLTNGSGQCWLLG